MFEFQSWVLGKIQTKMINEPDWSWSRMHKKERIRGQSFWRRVLGVCELTHLPEIFRFKKGQYTKDVIAYLCMHHGL